MSTIFTLNSSIFTNLDRVSNIEDPELAEVFDELKLAVELLVAEIDRAGLRHVETVTDSTYTITRKDGTILADGTSNTVDVTLPTAVGIKGTRYAMKAVDITNAVTLNPAGAELIDGFGSLSFTVVNSVFTVQSDGINWHVVSAY